jgi:RimJ/RimL family protein N-acetyltransferase
MLKYRPHSIKDIPKRIEWLNNKKINYLFVDDPGHTTTLAEQKKWFNAYRRMKNKKMFTILSNSRAIGLVGLTQINQKNKSAKIFILIGDDRSRNRGFGRQSLTWLIDYAFNTRKLRRLDLEVKKINRIAIKLYSHFGFTEKKRAGQEIIMRLISNINEP